MKQSEAKDFLPLIQAWAEGKTLQWFDGTEWEDVELWPDCKFHAGVGNYRIKPEPREWTLWQDTSGNLVELRGSDKFMREFGCKPIKVREVLDND